MTLLKANLYQKNKMAKKIKFSKWHGAGNDFIIIDDRDKKIHFTKKLVSFLGDRHFGVGFDQMMVIRKSRKADFRMDLFNCDGSRVEMCGNGIRCFAMYLYDRKITKKKELTVETDAGIIKPVIQKKLVKVDMGTPVLDGRKIPVRRDGLIVNQPLAIGTGLFNFTAVSMGNPHAVIFGNRVDSEFVQKHGPVIETHPLFPKKINVEFAKIVTRKAIDLRVWERGAGETLACGTGACATVVASVLNGFTERDVTVSLPGGKLKISWDEKTNHVFMTGSATEVFNGEISIR